MIAENLTNSTRGISIHGHADSTGTEQVNLRLSTERAKAVYHYLLGKYNIAEDRISFKGYGSSQPLTMDPKQLEKNRRIEVIIEK